jgi:hypothetical protein
LKGKKGFNSDWLGTTMRIMNRAFFHVPASPGFPNLDSLLEGASVSADTPKACTTLMPTS